MFIQHSALDDKSVMHMIILCLVESCNNIHPTRSTLRQGKNLHSRPSRTMSTEEFFCDTVELVYKVSHFITKSLSVFLI